jgi:hypothetical protein
MKRAGPAMEMAIRCDYGALMWENSEVRNKLRHLLLSTGRES